MSQPQIQSNILEGSWEEMLAKSQRFSGHQVRITLLEPLSQKANTLPDISPSSSEKALKGIMPPCLGSGNYEEIMSLVQSQPLFQNDDDFLEVIAENRTMRRTFTEEKGL